ncbi:RNA 3'-terminal phosphate cyclase [Pseudomonas sp. GOM7]|uniref:RNA 3'-terminal phosphate cyclase n=1 Tax=Pseudomonas sp. GOM7 TaxID=2998079 RepID=UPI00227AF08E|nr:RNA 3'-terminal phosphate cyclase [Pseudomonas sp. GOM7]WAJ38721.1 RNA 3'-terminal phosphate cyclase [Pseudomonas sp. GOM7]
MNKDLIELDGAIGGGQILRSALSLSMITGKPFRIHNIRAKRSRPGLLRQHLTAVMAAAQISSAQVEGAQLGAQSLSFAPGAIRGGNHDFAIGTAGSCSLVLQTLLPALLRADQPSQVHISGGTHNPMAPPFEFLERAWLPLLKRMGAQVHIELLRHGFAPAGGGAIVLRVVPSQLSPLHLQAPGTIHGQQATALVADVPGHVAERELERVGKRLKWPEQALRGVWLDKQIGPGNVLLLEIACEHLTEVFSSFGQSRVRAEQVADQAVDQVREWLHSGAAVAEHLADQLLLPLAMAGSGSFSTPRMSEHLSSNMRVIERFLDVAIHAEQGATGNLHISLQQR